VTVQGADHLDVGALVALRGEGRDPVVLPEEVAVPEGDGAPSDVETEDGMITDGMIIGVTEIGKIDDVDVLLPDHERRAGPGIN
jgi:hypothetical protein